MPYSRRIFLVILSLGVCCGASAQTGEVILLDTFDDDVVGQFPGTPEIGTSSHNGTGTHTIIDDYGSPRLRIVDIDPNNGTASTWDPVSLPLVSETSFTFQMEFYAGMYPVAHKWFGMNDGVYNSISLIWREDGYIQFNLTPVGLWSASRDYDIRMTIDCINNTAELLFDVLFWSIQPFECDELISYQASAFYSTSSNATFSIDNVMIQDFQPIFFDGFEDGDTLGWSAAVPSP